jgi:hypothetical protein
MALAAFAQTTKTAPQAKPKAAPVVKTQTATGPVKSVGATSLVITHKVKGNPEDIAFVLNTATKTTGTAAVGATATVHYTVEGNVNTATSVTYAAAKPPAAVKTSK